MSLVNNRPGATLALFTALTIMSAPTSSAALMGYSQDFESLDQTSGSALADDGWLVGANVFDPSGANFLYNYFTFPAPNGGAAFSGIDIGQGGAAQGDQQLSVYNDYNNGDHGVGNRIEANVFQEQIIDASDEGSIWSFSFDAKEGNIEGASTSLAFIKVLDPNAGFAQTDFVMIDMTSIGTGWSSFDLSVDIDAGQAGQILQFGFINVASNFEGSGMFYDNIEFSAVPVPGAVWLFASGFAALFGFRRKQ
ncbi:MAG: hypothetical protein AB8G17_00725 [Gammaproteobacteria bacterium]